MTRHAPIPEIDLLLLGYAAGTLSEALSLLAASYVSLSKEAQRRVYECEAVGGALLCHECPPEPMRSGSLGDVLSRLHGPETAELAAPRRRDAINRPQRISLPEALAEYELPLPLIEFIGGCAESIRWRRAASGFEMMVVPTSCTQVQVTLVRAVPGAPDPVARRTQGMRLVLQGGWVQQAQRHPAGTLLVYDEEGCEGAFACRSDGCLCLIVDEPRESGWKSFFLNLFG
jgi:putative transcriptional regulator